MGVVTVEIAGQRYPIRSSLDERYVAELAAYVDQKMRAAVRAVPESDMLGLAILVALIGAYGVSAVLVFAGALPSLIASDHRFARRAVPTISRHSFGCGRTVRCDGGL